MINRTTRLRLRASLAKGQAQGESHEQHVRRIMRVFAARQFEAERIARTEVVSAYNFASVESYKQAEIEELEWLTAKDERVRPEHHDADGQRVAVGQRFLVGGEYLEHPGDPVGSPGNIINCRCVTVPVVTVKREKPADEDWINRLLADVEPSTNGWGHIHESA